MNLKKSLVSPCRQDIRCLAVGKCILIIAVIARYGDIVLNSIARARYRRTCECRLCHRHTFLRTKYKHLNASCEVGCATCFYFAKILLAILVLPIFTSLAKIGSTGFMNIPLHHLNYDSLILAWMLAPLPVVGAEFTLLAGKALEQS